MDKKKKTHLGAFALAVVAEVLPKILEDLLSLLLWPKMLEFVPCELNKLPVSLFDGANPEVCVVDCEPKEKVFYIEYN